MGLGCKDTYKVTIMHSTENIHVDAFLALGNKPVCVLYIVVGPYTLTVYVCVCYTSVLHLAPSGSIRIIKVLVGLT